MDPSDAQACGQAVEEIDDAGLERVLGADDQQPVLCHEVPQDLRTLAQMRRRRADVRAHGRGDERIVVVAVIEQRFDRRDE